MTIGTELGAILEREGVTGYRVAKKTGLDETYISKILHNKINPTYLTLKRITNVLGYRICFEKVSQMKGGEKAKPKARKSAGKKEG